MSETFEKYFAVSGRQGYCRSIEAWIQQFDGFPSMIPNADWQIMERWHDQGVPLDLVLRTIRDLFPKIQARPIKRGFITLRRFAPAVERAWEEKRELQASAASRQEEPAFDLGARLQALAAALPAELADRERWVAAVEACAGDGGSEATEAALESLDHELLAAVLADLDGPAREALETEVEAALARLGDRLAGEDRARTRERLQRDRVRRRLGLPVLSLFAPEAQPE
jgi:hypothetical protein